MTLPVAIVVGHRGHAQGAVNVDGVSEWHWAARLADLVALELLHRGIHAEVVFRPDIPSGSYQALVDDLNTRAYAAAVCLHFNGSTNAAVQGFEVLCHPSSPEGRRLADALIRNMDQFLDSPNRGVKPTTVNGSGIELRVLTRTRAPAVIVESFFGSSPTDTARLDEPHELAGYARELADGVEEWTGWTE